MKKTKNVGWWGGRRDSKRGIRKATRLRLTPCPHLQPPTLPPPPLPPHFLLLQLTHLCDGACSIDSHLTKCLFFLVWHAARKRARPRYGHSLSRIYIYIYIRAFVGAHKRKKILRNRRPVKQTAITRRTPSCSLSHRSTSASGSFRCVPSSLSYSAFAFFSFPPPHPKCFSLQELLCCSILFSL